MEEQKPQAPFAALVYGEIVYWGVLLGSVIVMIGSAVAFMSRKNYIATSYWLSTIWKGESIHEIWQGATGAMPHGHWYLSHLTTGDGLCSFGISLGVFAVLPALLLSALALYKEKDMVYGTLALIGGIVVFIAILGIIPMPE